MAPPADRFARHPGQNSPSTHAHLPKPVQNSPNTAKIAHFGPFLARWAKIVTLKAQTPQAGRIFSRSWSTTYLGETNDTVSPPQYATIETTNAFAGIQSDLIETASTFAGRNAS